MTEPLADDDRSLRALGRRAREHIDARPLAWEAVTRGERIEDDVAAERLGAGDAPEAVALARELFRPPSEAEHDALVDALLEPRAAAREASAVVSPPSERAANDSPRRLWLWGIAAVAAVVALAWWLAPPRSSLPVEHDPPVVALAPLPSYALEHDGGLTSIRSDPTPSAEVLRYRRDTSFAWIMRPDVTVQGEVAARLFVFGEATAKELAIPGLVEVSPTGTVRVTGTIAMLGLPAGAWMIAIVVGRPSALPSEPAAIRNAASTETATGWTVRRLSLVVED